MMSYPVAPEWCHMIFTAQKQISSHILKPSNYHWNEWKYIADSRYLLCIMNFRARWHMKWGLRSLTVSTGFVSLHKSLTWSLVLKRLLYQPYKTSALTLALFSTHLLGNMGTHSSHLWYLFITPSPTHISVFYRARHMLHKHTYTSHTLPLFHRI